MRSTEAQEEVDGGGGGGEGRSGRAARRAPELQYFRRHSTFLKVMDPGGERGERVSHVAFHFASTQLWVLFADRCKKTGV